MKVLKKFFSFSIGGWLGAVVGFITIPLMTRIFTPEEFGKASMFTLALNVLMLFTTFGIDQAFVRFFYEENTIKLLKKCLQLTGVVYLCSIVIIYLFREPISQYLFGYYDLRIVIYLPLASVFYVLSNYAISVLRMNQLSWQYSVAQFGLRLFELIFILLFFYAVGNDYSALVYSKVATMLLVALLAMYLSKNVLLKVKDVVASHEYTKREILQYSYPLALTALLTWLLQSADKIAIKQWSSFDQLGIYMAAFRVIAVLEILGASFGAYWTPLALERYVNKTYEENEHFYKNANAVISIVMVIAATTFIMGKDIVVFFLGERYREATSLIPFLIFLPVMYIVSETTVMGINFKKKVRWHLVISSLVLIISISCNYLLVPKWGVKGAAMSIAIAYISYFILRTHISLRYYKIRYLLTKFYILVAALFSYAFYSSFYAWSPINILVGIALILLALFLYADIIKNNFKAVTAKI